MDANRWLILIYSVLCFLFVLPPIDFLGGNNGQATNYFNDHFIVPPGSVWEKFGIVPPNHVSKVYRVKKNKRKPHTPAGKKKIRKFYSWFEIIPRMITLAVLLLSLLVIFVPALSFVVVFWKWLVVVEFFLSGFLYISIRIVYRIM